MSTRPVYATSPEGLAALGGAFRDGHKMLQPPVTLTLSEWADRYAYIPKESSANPGKFQTSFAEYQRGAQDAITNPDIETVVFMWAAQTGKTQIDLNAIGFYSHWDPSPILTIQASEREAEKFSKNRVAKMIRDTPVLRKLFPSPRSRDSGNTLLNKEFPGGVLVMAGANAPAGLASIPIRVLIPDEVDRYGDSAGTEGDPVDIADKRTTTFWNRKKLLSSTPGIKHLSRIESAMKSSDWRRYYVPCPHCGEMQPLEWDRLKYEVEKNTTDERPRILKQWYVCVNGCVIEERSKHEMIRNGQWRATRNSHDGKTAGFHLNALYSPVLDWVKLVEEWLEAQGSLERLKVFVNTRMAETWEIRGTGANMHELEKRARFSYAKEKLPAGVLFLTAGGDVQDDRLECSIIGWGLNDERWVVDHRVFPGDTSLPDSDDASPWVALREYLLEEWEHPFGISMHVECALIDSAGHRTQRVYEFCRKHELRRWHACVGRAGWGNPLASSGRRVGPQKSWLYTVGVDTAKEDIFTSFKVAKPGAAYCHFEESLQGEYFAQVTAEKCVKTHRDFVTVMQWVKTQERNEALDCFVYARAAVSVLRPNFRKIAKNLFAYSEQFGKKPEPVSDPREETLGSAPTAEPVKELKSEIVKEEKVAAPAKPKHKRRSAASALQAALGRR